MCHIDKYVVIGSANGELHCLRANALQVDKEFVTGISVFFLSEGLITFTSENLTTAKMCASKTLAAHTTFVNQIELHRSGYLFTTGMEDECILQWKIEEEKPLWDKDFLDFDISKSDALELKYGELPDREKFQKLFNEILPARTEIFEIQQNIDDEENPDVWLELSKIFSLNLHSLQFNYNCSEAIIGRTACRRRNNLFYDSNERIVYSTGSLIVLASNLDDDDEDEERKENTKSDSAVGLKQDFLRVDINDIFSTSPEISNFTISDDKKYLCAGTIDTRAKLIVWEIDSHTCVKSLTLSNCSIIQLLRFAYDSRHICCVVLNRVN